MRSSKIAIITDTHIGARNNSKVFRELFREYFRDVLFPYLEENDINEVLHSGDFFDNRNSLSLHDVDFVVNEFLPLLEQYDVHMTIIAGNHDVAYRNTNKVNSLALLKTSDHVTVIENDIETYGTLGGKTFVLCPWINEENSDTLLKELKKYADDDHIAIMHAEIVGAKMYKNSKVCEHGIEPKELSKFHKVLSGHFHHPSRYGNIEYLGALFHFNWQDHDDWRGFHVYDPDTNEFEAVENPYCLFTQIEYTDDVVIDGDYIEGQIVRIVVNEEYDKVKLKDTINQIEKLGPISVDVIDNTIIESQFANVEDGDESQPDVKVKEIREYAEDAMKPLDNRKQLMSLFDDVYIKAQEKMREIE